MSEATDRANAMQREAADRILDVGLAMLAEDGSQRHDLPARRSRAWLWLAATLAALITIGIGLMGGPGDRPTAQAPHSLQPLLDALARAPEVHSVEQIAALPADTAAVRVVDPTVASIEGLARFTELRAIAIGGRPGADHVLTAAVVQALARHTRPRLLELCCVTVPSASTVIAAARAPDLEGLRLVRAPLPADLPAGCLQRLRYLAIEDRFVGGRFDQTATTDEALGIAVAAAPAIEELALLQPARVRAPGLARLADLDALRALRLQHDLLSSDMTAALADLRIRELDLSHSFVIRPGDLAPLAASQTIERLDVSFIPRLSSNDFLGLGDMQALREIDLSGLRGRSMASVGGVDVEVAPHEDIARWLRGLARAPNLQRVSMRGIDGVPLASLIDAAHEGWRWLDLRGAKLVAGGDGEHPEAPIEITDAALRAQLGVDEVLLDAPPR